MILNFLKVLGIWFGSLFVLTLMFQAAGFGRLGAFLWLGAFLSWSLFTVTRWAIRSDRAERTELKFAELVKSLEQG